MTKEKLTHYVENKYSLKQIADAENISFTTVRYWLKKYKLKTYYVTNQEANLTNPKITKYCSVCQTTKNADEFYLRKNKILTTYCKPCMNKNATSRQQEVKRMAVNAKGGKCHYCGYNKYLGALEFHHIDPKTKDPKWSSMKSKSFEAIQIELDKCLLVCANCHREVHAKLLG